MYYLKEEYSDLPSISTNTLARYYWDSFASCNQSYVNVDYVAKALICHQFTIVKACIALKILLIKFTMAPDKIPSLILHDCNISLEHRRFPSTLNNPKSFPFLRGDSSSIENYRLITIIIIISNVFEASLYIPIYSHIKNMMRASQHGFITHRSTYHH